MKAIELVGKLAIRTNPIKLGRDFITEENNYDYSYTNEPIRILKVTDNHILTTHKGTKLEKIFRNDIHILDKRWNDDNWTDYEELIKMEEYDEK